MHRMGIGRADTEPLPLPLAFHPPPRRWQLPSHTEPVLIKAGLKFYRAVSNLTHACWDQVGQIVAGAFEDNPKELGSSVGALSLLKTT